MWVSLRWFAALTHESRFYFPSVVFVHRPNIAKRLTSAENKVRESQADPFNFAVPANKNDLEKIRNNYVR